MGKTRAGYGKGEGGDLSR